MDHTSLGSAQSSSGRGITLLTTGTKKLVKVKVADFDLSEATLLAVCSFNAFSCRWLLVSILENPLILPSVLQSVCCTDIWVFCSNKNNNLKPNFKSSFQFVQNIAHNIFPFQNKKRKSMHTSKVFFFFHSQMHTLLTAEREIKRGYADSIMWNTKLSRMGSNNVCSLCTTQEQ